MSTMKELVYAIMLRSFSCPPADDYSPNTTVSGILLEASSQDCQGFTAVSDDNTEVDETFTVSLTIMMAPTGTGIQTVENSEVIVTINDTQPPTTPPTTPPPPTPTGKCI